MIATADFVSIVSGAIGAASFVAAALYFWWHLREIRRTQASTERNLAATREVGRETLSALQLHDVIVGDEHLEKVVKDLATDYVRLSQHADPLATLLAGRELDEIKRFMTMGAEGYITVDSNAFSHADRLASELLRTTGPHDEFWASSLVAQEFWSHATAYVGQQVAKAESRVDINRVFVFDNVTAFRHPQAQEQMALQARDGIKVSYVIDPPYEMRDLVVVRKRPQQDDRRRRKVFSRQLPTEVVPVYAMECRVGVDKRIDHIDLWTTYGLHSTRVDETWWNLDAIFKQSTEFRAESTASLRLVDDSYAGAERRTGERRTGERRDGDRRVADRRAASGNGAECRESP